MKIKLNILAIFILSIGFTNDTFSQTNSISDSVGVCIAQKKLNLYETEDFVELKSEPIIQSTQILIYGIDLNKNILKVINVNDGNIYFTTRNLFDKTCNLKVDTLLRIWNNKPDMLEKDRLEKANFLEQIILEQIENKKKLQELNELQKVLKAGITNKLLIYEYNVTGGDYSIGFDITIENTHNSKTIKYIYFDVVIKNPVKDIVATKSVKGIGPIEPNTRSSYSFEDILYSRVATNISLKNIKIQYMDGTIINLNKNILDKIELTEEMIELMKSNE